MRPAAHPRYALSSPAAWLVPLGSLIAFVLVVASGSNVQLFLLLNGLGLMTSDALWAGLPVVTCSGQAFASRMAGSLLEAMGMGDCVTQSLEEYERLAIALANDPDRLGELRRRLARNRSDSPLYDSERFCRSLESAYGAMCDRHRSGASPCSFSVE